MLSKGYYTTTTPGEVYTDALRYTTYPLSSRASA